MPRLLAVLLALAAGCLPRIPAPAAVSPLPPPRATVQVCRLTAERSERGLWSAVDGAGAEPWHMCTGSIVVRRPDGLLMIDSGFGRAVREDLARAPLHSRLLLGGAAGKTPVVTLADRAGLDPLGVRWVALTHAHWDHTGGLRDLARARVLLPRAELRAYWNLHGAMVKGGMPRHFELPERRFEPFDYDGPPLLGFEQSHDLFGDGSVVAVPLPGHTPGSAGYLVRGADGANWLFIGDAAWAVEGVARPAHKSALLAATVDADAAQTAATLGRLHAVHTQVKDVVVVPAHDLAAMGRIPECAPAASAPSAR